MTIDQERVNTSKFNIRQALLEKGVEVPSSTPLDEYPPLIRGISGGGDGSQKNVVILDAIWGDLDETWTLPKTAREIYDLFVGGTTILVRRYASHDGEGYNEEIGPIYWVSVVNSPHQEEPFFLVDIQGWRQAYYANSWDEYPVGS